MKRLMVLFLMGCAYPITTEPNPAPSMDSDSGVVMDAGADVVYQKPEEKHFPDVMPPICHVAACRAWTDDRILGVCDPCEDAGELCKFGGEYGTCRFY